MNKRKKEQGSKKRYITPHCVCDMFFDGKCLKDGEGCMFFLICVGERERGGRVEEEENDWW